MLLTVFMIELLLLAMVTFHCLITKSNQTNLKVLALLQDLLGIYLVITDKYCLYITKFQGSHNHSGFLCRQQQARHNLRYSQVIMWSCNPMLLNLEQGVNVIKQHERMCLAMPLQSYSMQDDDNNHLKRISNYAQHRTIQNYYLIQPSGRKSLKIKSWIV